MTKIVGHIWYEKLPEKGEDGPPIAREDMIAVFDGLGGAGGEKVPYKDGVVTQARMASSACSERLRVWLEGQGDERVIFPFDDYEGCVRFRLRLKQCFTDYLSRIAARYRIKVEQGNSLRKTLPTTFAGVATDNVVLKRDENGEEKPGTIPAIIFWCGDSRVYTIREEGMHALSCDDVAPGSPTDAFESEDSRGSVKMSQQINLSKDFSIHCVPATLLAPCFLFVSTDGFHGYCGSPMHVEYTMLDALMKSKTVEEMNERLWPALVPRNGQLPDDVSVAYSLIGFESIAQAQQYFAGRYRELEKLLQDAMAQTERTEEDHRLLEGQAAVERQLDGMIRAAITSQIADAYLDDPEWIRKTPIFGEEFRLRFAQVEKQLRSAGIEERIQKAADCSQEVENRRKELREAIAGGWPYLLRKLGTELPGLGLGGSSRKVDMAWMAYGKADKALRSYQVEKSKAVKVAAEEFVAWDAEYARSVQEDMPCDPYVLGTPDEVFFTWQNLVRKLYEAMNTQEKVRRSREYLEIGEKEDRAWRELINADEARLNSAMDLICDNEDAIVSFEPINQEDVTTRRRGYRDAMEKQKRADEEKWQHRDMILLEVDKLMQSCYARDVKPHFMRAMEAGRSQRRPDEEVLRELLPAIAKDEMNEYRDITTRQDALVKEIDRRGANLDGEDILRRVWLEKYKAGHDKHLHDHIAGIEEELERIERGMRGRI